MRKQLAFLAAVALAGTTAGAAQPQAQPRAAAAASVQAGTYQVDPNHTQVSGRSTTSVSAASTVWSAR